MIYFVEENNDCGGNFEIGYVGAACVRPVQRVAGVANIATSEYVRTHVLLRICRCCHRA